MALQRMDNVLIVVNDLDATIAFFLELGMELEGRTNVQGPWVDTVVGLENVDNDIAMLRTPDGHSKVELAKFNSPTAAGPDPATPVNTLGIRRIMFAVDDIHDTIARLEKHGATMVGEVAQFENMFLLAYIRGPEGIMLGLAEQLG